MIGLAGGKERLAKAIERNGFTGAVADLTEQRQNPALVVGSLPMTAPPQVNDTEEPQA